MAVTSPNAGRPVGASGPATRERIIEATMRCVAQVGYSRATIREIAKTAGLTNGSLYHYFPNKSELLRATVDSIEAIALPRLRAAAARDAHVLSRLDAVLDESDCLLREYPFLAGFDRAMRMEGTADPAGAATSGGFTVLRGVIDEIIGDAVRDGTLRAGTDARGVTDVVYALTRGLTEQAARTDTATHHDAVAAAKELLRGTVLSPR